MGECVANWAHYRSFTKLRRTLTFFVMAHMTNKHARQNQRERNSEKSVRETCILLLLKLL
jgi:hypothetical protein